MADVKKKDLILTCTNIALLPDGRQSIQMIKPPSSPTSSLASGGVQINPNEAELTLKADSTDSYAIGKTYTISIS